MSVIGIIPAAGKGTRIPLPYPKELVPVTYEGNRVITVIEANLRQLANAGVTEAVVVIRPEKQIIKDYLGDYHDDVHLHYVYQSRMNSKEGLTDAVMSAKPLASSADLCIMLMADVYFTDKHVVRQLVSCIGEVPDAVAAVSVWPTVEPHRFGIVTLDQFRVTRVVDKPEGITHGYHWGAIAFQPDFWFYMDYELETMSMALSKAAKEKVVYHHAQGHYLDLGLPKSLIEGIVEVNT